MLDRDTRLTPRAREMRTNATKQENHLWYDYLRGYPIRFFRQFIIGEYITDFCCRRAKLVVELDGGYHLNRKEYDEERDAYLRGRGFEVLRFANEDIDYKFERVCRTIDEAVTRRGFKPPSLEGGGPKGRGVSHAP